MRISAPAFIQSGGSSGGARSVTLTVASATASNASEYDYQCDGTADEVQINAAVSALSSGGRVVLSEGTFSIDATVSIGVSNTTLEGQGAGTILRLANGHNSATARVITVAASTSYVTIRNLAVDGNYTNQTDARQGIYLTDSSVSYTIIENCVVTDTVAANILDNGATHTTIRNNVCDTTSPGFGSSNVEQRGSYATIDGNTLISGDAANVEVVSGLSGVSVTNNKCLTAGTGGSAAIDVLSSCQVSGNLIINPSTSAIHLDQQPSTVSGNSIFVTNDPTSALIYVSFGPNMIIDGNYMQVATGNTIAVTGIRSATLGVTLSNNSLDFLTSEAHVGILMTADQQIVTGNYISLASLTSGSYGIQANGSDYSTITNCQIDQMETAIDISATTETQVVGCQIFDCTFGVQVDTVSSAVISNNVFEAARNAVFSTSNSITSDLAITGNVFQNMTQHTVLLRSTRRSTVTGNVFRRCCSGTNDTYSCVFINTSSGTNYSINNIVSSNQFSSNAANKPQYNVREGSVNDGPTIVTSNVALDAVTAQVSLQHGSSVNANNIVT